MFPPQNLCYKQLFFSCKLSYSSSKSPSRLSFSILQLQSSLCPLVLSSMQFYSVSSPPPLIDCILLLTSHTPFAWPTNPRPSCAERCRPGLDTRIEICGMITTGFYQRYPVFLYIMRHHWQITVCFVGSQPISLQTQTITPSLIVALPNRCPPSAHPGSDFLLFTLPTNVNKMTI